MEQFWNSHGSQTIETFKTYSKIQMLQLLLLIAIDDSYANKLHNNKKLKIPVKSIN